MKDPLNYTLEDQLIPEASSCKYLGTISHSDLNWDDHVNCRVIKAWKALHFIMRIHKKGNSTTKSSAYTTLYVRLLNMGLHAGIHSGRDK